MRVYYLSDLHANHHVPFRSNQEKWEKFTKEWMQSVLSGVQGEVLVLNGDFSEFNQQTLWLLEVAADHFERVLFLPGNHDYYLLSKNQRKKYKTSFGRVDELVELASRIPNVVYLNQRVFTYKGVTFSGETLWYDLPRNEDQVFYQDSSNDSQFIHTGISFVPGYKVLHDLSMNWYHTLAGKLVDVFVSHVPPVHPPHSGHPYNACYVTPVPFLAAEHWIAGHQHSRGVFEKADTTFYMNPLGYPGEYDSPNLASFVV